MPSDIKRYGDAGIHTVEGNLAGSRAARLTKQRESQKQEFEKKKQDITDTHQRAARIEKTFESYHDDEDAEFKRQTVGLVTAEEFRKKRETLSRMHRNEPRDCADIKLQSRIKSEMKDSRKRKLKKDAANLLSFSIDEDMNDQCDRELESHKRRSMKKNPFVETSFLPDKERDKEDQLERERLRQEWEEEQERIKNGDLTVTYSYWNGSGNRREITIQKKLTIGQYLELVKEQLVPEFSELRGVSSDNLLYVKEDLIIPHHHTFYDLIVTKARGKSGPLFHFDVHDDVRLINDFRVEKDESHPGKVVERRWYEKNKHIFPASRWEVYDPNIKREKYTIHGNEVKK